MLRALSTQLVGSYTKPNWLIRHQRVTAPFGDDSFWRPDAEVRQEALDDATRLAIVDQERAGLDLVTTGDIVIASVDATFFDPHVSIGLVSGREMVRLARVLPLNVAMRVALTGRHERLSAQRAYDLGLVTELVEPERLAERAREIATLINRNAPLAVRGTRLAIRKGLGLPLYEAELLAEAFRERVTHTDDAQEGPRAFLEKRQPEWTGE